MAPTQSYFDYVGLIILEGIILDNYVTIFIVIFYKEKFSNIIARQRSLLLSPGPVDPAFSSAVVCQLGIRIMDQL